MPSSRRKAVFSLEDAREAVMNSDSENEFDNMSIDLDSEEDYSDVDDEGNHHVQPSEFDEFSDPEYDAPSSPNGPADLGSGVGGDGGEQPVAGEEESANVGLPRESGANALQLPHEVLVIDISTYKEGRIDFAIAFMVTIKQPIKLSHIVLAT